MPRCGTPVPFCESAAATSFFNGWPYRWEFEEVPEPFLEWANSVLRASERAVLGGGLLGQASRDLMSPGRFVIRRNAKKAKPSAHTGKNEASPRSQERAACKSTRTIIVSIPTVRRSGVVSMRSSSASILPSQSNLEEWEIPIFCKTYRADPGSQLRAHRHGIRRPCRQRRV